MKTRNARNLNGDLFIDGSNITAADVNQYIQKKEQKIKQNKNIVEVIKKVGKKELLRIANAISEFILKEKKAPSQKTRRRKRK